MVTGIRKNHFKPSVSLIIGLACLLLLLSTGQDLFHNHEPDSDSHHECPAYQIYLMLSAAIVFDCTCRFFLLLVLIFKRIFRQAEYSNFHILHHGYL